MKRARPTLTMEHAALPGARVPDPAPQRLALTAGGPQTFLCGIPLLQAKEFHTLNPKSTLQPERM